MERKILVQQKNVIDEVKVDMKNVIYFILVSLLIFTACKKNSNPTSPTEDASTVTYSGKVYHTVKIGNQTWLKENLDVGTMIQGTASSSNNGVIEKYCYGNDTTNCNKYGGLYQWNEAMAYDTADGAKGICPTGWHIPTKAEFDTLAIEEHYNGNSLKAIGQGKGSGAGTDSSGFFALLAGYRSTDSTFIHLDDYTTFWSSTERSEAYYPTLAWDVALWYTDSGISMYTNNKAYSFSIRCLKDE